MYKKILLAFDGTREGRAALRQGAEIASLCGAEADVLAVVRPPTNIAFPEGVYPVESITAEQEEARELVREGVTILRDQGVTARGHMGFGDPADQIKRMVEEFLPDLVVVGHRRQGPLARWWQGSLGRSLLDIVDCSILIAMCREQESQEDDAVQE